MFPNYCKIKSSVFVITTIIYITSSLSLCQVYPIPGPQDDQLSGGRSSHILQGVIINISSNPSNAYRGDSITVNYNITYWGGKKGESKKIYIKTPVEFDSYVLEGKPDDIAYNEEKQYIIIDGTGEKMNYIQNICLSYSARIATDSNIVDPLYLNPHDYRYIVHEYEKKCYSGNGCYIYIKNNNPNITSFKLDNIDSGDGSPLYKLYRDEETYFLISGTDREHQILNWSFYYINQNNKNEIYLINSSFSPPANMKIPYVASLPGEHQIELKLSDNDGGSDNKTITVQVHELTRNEHLSEIYTEYIWYIFYFSFVVLIFRSKLKSRYVLLISTMLFLLLMLVLWYLKSYITVPDYILSLYMLMLIFAAYFIEANFNPEENPIQQGSLKDRLYLTMKNYVFLIKNIPESMENIINNRNKIRRIKGITKPDVWLWFVTTITMALIIIIILKYLPTTSLFLSGDSELLHTYIFTYYTVNIGAFGVILAIIISFAIWYIETKKISIDPRIYKRTVTNFIFLYMILILLSVIGLVIGTIPLLEADRIINSIPLAISITTFVCTLLLIVPAFLCLYEFANWIMEMAIMDNEPVSDDLNKLLKNELENIENGHRDYYSEEYIKSEMGFE